LIWVTLVNTPLVRTVSITPSLARSTHQIPGGPVGRDISIWVTLRDHANLDFYYMVANTPAWKRVSLGAVDWKAMKGTLRCGGQQGCDPRV